MFSLSFFLLTPSLRAQPPQFLLPFLLFTVSILQLSPNNCRFSFLFLFSCLPHPYYRISSNLPSEASPSWACRQCQYSSATCEFCCLRSHGKMRPPSLLTLGTHMTLLGQWDMSRSNVWHSQGSNQHPFSKTMES